MPCDIPFAVSSVCPAGTEGQIYSCHLSYDLLLPLLTEHETNHQSFTTRFPTLPEIIYLRKLIICHSILRTQISSIIQSHHIIWVIAPLVYDFLDKSYGRKEHACQWNTRHVAMEHERMCASFCVCGGVGTIYCTFSFHAHCQTLLEAAERTTFPLRKVHSAALLFCTDVMLVILH